MKFIVLSFLVCIVVVNARNRAPPSGVGHYWRDYESNYFPSDAFDVGTNSLIAQVHTHGVLVTGNLNKVSGIAEYAYNGKAYSTKHEVKMLCTTDPTQFEWIKTDSQRIHFLLPTRFFVIGGNGYEIADKVIVGRSLTAAQVGSIYLYSQNNGLQYAKNERAYREGEFEALAYKES